MVKRQNDEAVNPIKGGERNTSGVYVPGEPLLPSCMHAMHAMHASIRWSNLDDPVVLYLRHTALGTTIAPFLSGGELLKWLRAGQPYDGHFNVSFIILVENAGCEHTVACYTGVVITWVKQKTYCSSLHL
jgi:hypothetical protein